jgi:hypothetical protein
VLSVQGESNESLVLDGEWFEKQRGAEQKARLAASSFRSVEWKEFEKRKKLFGSKPRTARRWKRSSPGSKPLAGELAAA